MKVVLLNKILVFGFFIYSQACFSIDNGDGSRQKTSLELQQESAQKSMSEQSQAKIDSENEKGRQEVGGQLSAVTGSADDFNKEIAKIGDTSDFGSAFLTFIRNNTAYPMSILLDSKKEDLIDQIPEGSIIRIKSLKSSLGERGKYYSVANIDSLTVLKADASDPTAANTDLLVRKYKNTDSGKAFLGLALPTQSGKLLISRGSNQVQFGPSYGGFQTEQGTDSQWTIHGSRFDVCYLKNRLTQGFLGPQTSDETESEVAAFPPQSQPISWKGVTGQKGKIELVDLESGLAEKESLPISQLVWRANKARQHYLESSLTSDKALMVFNGYLEQARLERKNFASSNKELIFYGDKIKISHSKTMQSLYSGNAHPGASDYQTVFCSNGDDQDQVDDPLACWWIIKGPHHPTDRFNCQIGAPVQMGDIIRLENVKSGKNLSAKFLSKDFDLTLKTESVPENYDRVQIFANGSLGIGSEEDNWAISALDGSGQELWKAREIFLLNAMTQTRLHSMNAFFKFDGQKTFLQTVLALKQKDSSSSTSQGLDPSKAKDLAGKSVAGPNIKKDESVVSQVSDKDLAEISKSADQASAAVKAETQKRTAAPEPDFITSSRGWFISNVFRSKMPKNNVAWTGFENGSIFEDDPDQRISIEIVKPGFDSAIKPGQTMSQTFQLKNDKPRISGFAMQKIDQVSRDSILILPPMLGKGIAWFNQPFQIPGKFCASFLARTVEDGRLEIFLGQTVDLNWAYKLVIGSGGGQKTSIFKNVFKDGKSVEVEVFSIDKKDNLLAGLNAGNFMPYWVCASDGNISHGVGMSPGKNIVASWTDQNVSLKPTRIGFGSYKVESQYTGFVFGKALKINPPDRIFATIDKSFDLSSGQDAWFDKSLQVPGLGCVSFSAQGTGHLMLSFAESKDPGSWQYALSLDTDKGSAEILEWNSSKGIYEKRFDTGRQDAFMINAARRNIWISFDDEQLFLGSGDQFQTLNLTGIKKPDFSNFSNINISCKKGSVSVQEIKLGSPVQLVQDDSGPKETKNLSVILDKNFVEVVCPFDYLLDQSGPSIIFKDQILGTSQFMGKASTRGSRYEFILAVGPDGLPQLTWTREPENATQLRIKILGKTLRGAGQSLFLAASQMESTGKMSPDDVKDGKMDPGSALAAAASFATTGVGMGIIRGGIELEAMSIFDYDKSLVSQTKEGYGGRLPTKIQKQDAGFVYQDKELQTKKAGTEIPYQAQENKYRLDEQMAMGQKWIASTPEKLTQLLPLYKQAIGLIIHPFVVKDQTTRKAVIENLESLYQAQDEFFGKANKIDLSYGVLMDLILTAYFNPYLIDSSDAEGSSIRQIWLARVSNLADKMLSIDGYLELPALQNAQIWLGKGFETKNKGTVSFQAKGQGDLIISLFPEIISDKLKVDGYKIIFGARDNSTIQISVGDFTAPVASAKIDGGVLNQIVSKSFWITLDGGKLTIGHDEPNDKNKLLEWTDPYPSSQINRIGISTKNISAAISSFSIK